MNVDTTEESPTCITTCYGIGGLDEGLERVVGKLRKLCIVEIEAVAIANMVAKMEAGGMAPCPIWTDLKTFPAHLFRGKVDWLLGGYPCTPFSLAGKRRGADDPRHLWPHLERIIKTIRPVRCLFENVDDHLTLGFPEVYCSLRNMGYAVEVGVYSAEEVGAPHERQRMFILAVANGYRDDVRSGRTSAQRTSPTIEEEEQQRQRSGTELGNGCDVEYTDSERLGEEGECEVGIDRASELGNSTRIIKRKQADETNAISDDRKTRDESFGSSQLADTNREQWRIKQQFESRDGKRTRNQSTRRGEMANANDKRLEGQWRRVKRTGTEHAVSSGSGKGTKWPSRPGQPQQAWEHLRVISRETESDVGLSANGYHFREDFLRALGNMVVPDCAEKAIYELLNKY